MTAPPSANTKSAWQTVQSNNPSALTALRWLPYSGLISLLAVPSLIIAIRRTRSL